ncbi:protein CHUP1, chloroplastic-like [Henckelia pumila]|uniref:protein CHUP1, chloroplastic-like n=1 Tax=Henckelia pumila TaxID=405737 RepID=UPI003C6E0697
MVAREKRDFALRPVLVKFGVGLAISLGGILYTFFRSRGIKPSILKSPLPSPDKVILSDSIRESERFSADDCALKRESSLAEIDFVTNLSPSVEYSGDRHGFLLPEFMELVTKCDLDVTACSIAAEKNLGTQVLDVESPKEFKCSEPDERSSEINSLRNQVEILEERERYLEIRLLEYYGLKEQETAVEELQNQLRISNMEAKLNNTKIESLLSDNTRLEAQVADYAKVVTELETAKAKIKILRKKLRFEAEQNREQILSLRERVMKLQDEGKRAIEDSNNMEMHQQKENELEELEVVKKSNHDLKLANSELAKKLEYLQILATFALDNEEAQELKEENQRLQKQNKSLSEEIEHVQADRCTDIEELVYLRWINACLRYELRNYQPFPGKTVARDLSKTLSPKSEEKAKQLILEYASNEGSDLTEFDPEQWSTFQASLTDSGEHNDSLSANTTSHFSKMKFFAKLMKVLRGKNCDHHSQTSIPVDYVLDRYSSDSHSVISDGFSKMLRTPWDESSGLSLELQRSYSRGESSIVTGESHDSSRRTSEDGSLNIFRQINLITEDINGFSLQNRDAQNIAKNELVKYAEALKNSRMKPSFHRRSAPPFNSF